MYPYRRPLVVALAWRLENLPVSIAGCDFSTKAVDIVLLDEDSDAAEWHRVLLAGHDAFERARDVRTAMRAILPSEFWDDVMALGIEQPRGNFGVTHMMRIQGAILASLPTSLLVHPINPSDWRKTVGLRGNATQVEIADWVQGARFLATMDPLLSDWPQDACDAYCIALATRTLLQHGQAAA